jgi:hypothetical protein
MSDTTNTSRSLTTEIIIEKISKFFKDIYDNMTFISTIYISLFILLTFCLIYYFTRPKEGFFGIGEADDDSAKNTKEQNSKQVKIDEVERQIQDRLNNINTNLTALKTRIDESDIVKDNKPTNLAIAIQNNILAVKEAMMKIIAGLVVQTKMNNGAISVVSQTNAFQNEIDASLKNITK